MRLFPVLIFFAALTVAVPVAVAQTPPEVILPDVSPAGPPASIAPDLLAPVDPSTVPPALPAGAAMPAGPVGGMLMPVPKGALNDRGSVSMTPEFFAQSLMFTEAEIKSLVSAVIIKRAPGNAPPVMTNPDGSPVLDDQGQPVPKPVFPPISLNRKITLSGIFYRSPDNWVIWLNGRKVTPKDRPRELVGIKVENGRAHIRWFDIGLAKVISISMRPRQTYDIVSGVMLPE